MATVKRAARSVMSWPVIFGSGALIAAIFYSRRRKKVKQSQLKEEQKGLIRPQKFFGKTVVITGAAGDIGSATAKAFAREGATLVLVDLPSTCTKLDKDRTYLLSEGAEKVVILSADVSKSESVQKMVSDAITNCGQIDCFFNNAGVQGELLPLHEQSDSDFVTTTQINLTGVFLGMKYVSRAMIDAKRGGVIVNTASMAGLIGPANMGAYAASKFGVVGLTKTGAKDLGPFNIRVCAIAPGLVEGKMWDRQVKGKAALRKIDGGEVTAKEIEEQEARMIANTPLGRIGRLSEVAEVVVFLCSESASYMSGSVIPIDGARLQ